MTDDDRDWRSWAYLSAEYWPEAIPPMGPKRERGPYAWHGKHHYDPHNLDDYPNSHPDAASVGGSYLGDVCPYCGVPLDYLQEVVLHDGTKGRFSEINETDDPVPAYHPECWDEREAERRGLENTTLGAYQ